MRINLSNHKVRFEALMHYFLILISCAKLSSQGSDQTQKHLETAIQEQVATALVVKGFTLGKLNRNEDAISAYHEVVRRFGDVMETAIQERGGKSEE